MKRNAAKKAAGEEAAILVRDGIRLGLDTGSTTAYTLTTLGRRSEEENLDVRSLPISFATERVARGPDIPLTNPDDNLQLDLVMDGGDQVGDFLRLDKGRDNALAREKVIAMLISQTLEDQGNGPEVRMTEGIRVGKERVARLTNPEGLQS